MLVCGVGVNDADYQVKVWNKGHRETCPFYQRWTNMLIRCYREDYIKRFPTYKGCSVCDEWKVFSNFKSWMENQDWKGKQLDKDFLIDGNKIYSPNTCVFIDGKINSLLTNCGEQKGAYYNSNIRKYISQCRDGHGKVKHIGDFKRKKDALKAYKEYKSKIIIMAAERQSDSRIKKILTLKAKL